MIKKLIKFLFFFIIILIIVITYLSIFGYNTKKLNEKIEDEVLNINKKINLELRSVKLLLNPLELSINVKTFGPKIIINKKDLELEYIKSNISLKSFLKRELHIDNLQISTKTIKLKDLILLTRSFKNSPEIFIIDNIVKEGFVVGDINLNFDSNGQIKKDYEIKGFIKKGKLNILNRYTFNNLDLIFDVKDKYYNLKDVKGEFNKIKLQLPTINIKEEKNQFLVNGELRNREDDINIEFLNDLLGKNFKEKNIEELKFSSKNNFFFILNKKFKIKGFNFKSKINLIKLIYKNNLLDVKKYLPSLDEVIELNNHQISVEYKKDNLDVIGEGKVKIENDIDTFSYKLKKNKMNQYIFSTNINLKNNPLSIDFLQYKKKENTESDFEIKGIFTNNKKIKINSILFNENKNKFLIKNLYLNNKYKIEDIGMLKLEYINTNKVSNSIILKKDKKNYKLNGKIFDLTNLIDKILNNEGEESHSIFDSITTNIDIKIDKVYLDSATFVNNFNGYIDLQNNRITKLNLNSLFPNNEKLNLTINKNDKDEKITTLFSGYPKSLVKNYKFIKGFDEGILDFYSVEKNGLSNSLLTIDNFKIKEVPVFAKLLSLASLQGIADILTGEGLRFTDFEMRFSNKKGLMTIEEMYAIGPAVSILMEGYIETRKLISLRGTMVPATTINKTIASIPLIGDILVGKKVGEGVFGVSFKIKGPPKNLKTTVNPIKTLTPRFITRTLEKIKKN